jgi:hypothetical protein
VRPRTGGLAGGICIPAIWNALEGNHMLDFVMIAIGVGFFVASILYVLACERM